MSLKFKKPSSNSNWEWTFTMDDQPPFNPVLIGVCPEQGEARMIGRNVHNNKIIVFALNEEINKRLNGEGMDVFGEYDDLFQAIAAAEGRPALWRI